MVLYNYHRQTIPLVLEEENKRRYIFLKDAFLWRFIPFKSSNKIKFKIIYSILLFLKPAIILDINWINFKGAVYHLWAKKNRPSKFIVLQHGSYIGGIVTDNAHKYAHCDIFLTWGEFFSDQFKMYNYGKEMEVLTFGNSVLNGVDRSKLSYKKAQDRKVLIAPSGIKGSRLKAVYNLTNRLEDYGFEVFFRQHRFQKSRFQDLNKSIKLDDRPLKEIFLSLDYDFIVSDHSSLMLDAIYSKNRVVFFSAPGEITEYLNNNFTQYLSNIYYGIDEVNSIEDIYAMPNEVKQEMLLDSMIYKGNNQLL